MARRPTRRGEAPSHAAPLSPSQRAAVTRVRLAELRRHFGDAQIDKSWSRIKGRVPARREQWLRMMEAGARGDRRTARALQISVMDWLKLAEPLQPEMWQDPMYADVWY